MKQGRRGAPGRWRFGMAATAACALLVAGCAETTPKVGLGDTDTKEYFSEAEYGVKASPRMAHDASGLRRGGGRYHIGKPYRIKNRWYHPKEDPDYVAEGTASWYGAAFHGRLTANGEVYDMTHLTAAHPTLPLPSYARVTNLENGSSVIVRINDRGPFARGRVIDLSKRAAELLDYHQDGVARVRVEYVGPAPLHGQDDSFLLASYRPSGRTPDPSDGLASGVMVAMNGPTPSQAVPQATTAFAGLPTARQAQGSTALPVIGPVLPDRPHTAPELAAHELALLSYADRRVRRAADAFDAVLRPGLDAETLASWGAERMQAPGSYINLGVWSSRAAADRLEDALSAYGEVRIEETLQAGRRVYALSLVPAPGGDLDRALRAAWAAGAADAFAVRG